VSPTITFVSVVYNVEASLAGTIESIGNLNYPNKQYIVIDGGSTDGTVEIIRRYSHNISYWVTEKDNGIYDAMNKAWEQASLHSYILFLGAGDKILSVPASLDDTFSKVYYGDVLIGNKLFKSKANFFLKLGNTLHHQALLIPKALCKNAPFNVGYKVYADFDFNQRLLKKDVTFEYSSDLKAYALPGGCSAERNTVEMKSIVRKNFGVFFSSLAGLYYRLQNLKNS
jgi:glycosyltransferase involved in cell wall biosynthesis